MRYKARMLQQLTIHDYTLIEALELEFYGGLTVLTGETGAGKSIVIDALGLVLGDRADSRAIRQGATKAEIVAVFTLKDNPAAHQWLGERELGAGNECFLRRVITAEGRSRAWINGQPMPMQELKVLGELLVDLHGQQEHQLLLRRAMHRHLLDGYGGLQLQGAALDDAWQQWSTMARELDELRAQRAQRLERRSLLEFQLDELATLDAGASEFEELSAEQRKLAHAEEIGRTLRAVIELSSDEADAGLSRMINRAVKMLAPLPDCGVDLQNAQAMLDTARINISEAQIAIGTLLDSTKVNPARLAEVESRLSDLHQMARKYRVDPKGLIAQRSRFATELEGLSNTDQHVEALEHAVVASRQAYEAKAATLSAARRLAGDSLSTEVQRHLHELAMEHCCFVVDLKPLDGEPQRYGREQTEFLVATIPGHPPDSLRRVASGGELSRISLAIQVVTAATTAIPTVVFDEVDVGIGGATAEIVGRLLRALGERGQALCVTHLPQVAAFGHQHLRVSKHMTRSAATAELHTLEQLERVEEIARMLGGRKLTAATRKHAREMLADAE